MTTTLTLRAYARVFAPLGFALSLNGLFVCWLKVAKFSHSTCISHPRWDNLIEFH